MSFSNVTSAEFSPVNAKGVIEEGRFVVQFKGSISIPVNQEKRPDQLQICVDYASYAFRASRYVAHQPGNHFYPKKCSYNLQLFSDQTLEF